MRITPFYTLLVMVFLSVAGHSQEIPQKQQKYVNKFISSVVNHEQNKTIRLLDKTYSKEQIAFLGGNKQQFLDELLGGTEVATDGWINLRYAEIQSIEVAEVTNNGDGTYTYFFRIRDGQHDVYSDLLLRLKNGKYGFVGAVG